MRWRDMQGPIGPIIKQMAAHYAARRLGEFDDLQQEAWLGIYAWPKKPLVLAAWTGITNYVASQRSRLRWDATSARPERHSPWSRTDARLDAAELLARMDDATREAAILMFWEGLTRKETAKRLGCDGTTIRRRFVAFRETLQTREGAPRSVAIRHAGRIDDGPRTR